MLGSLLLASTAPAWADVGVPLINFLFPGFWMLLPAVILLEWAIAILIIKKGAWVAVKVAAISNGISTLLGIPLKSILVAALIPVVSQITHFKGEESWKMLSPFQKFALAIIGSTPIGVGWRSPAEFELVLRLYWGLLLLPFFFLSVWIEWLVAKRLLHKDGKHLARRWAWAANLVSYLMVFLLVDQFLRFSDRWLAP